MDLIRQSSKISIEETVSALGVRSKTITCRVKKRDNLCCIGQGGGVDSGKLQMMSNVIDTVYYQKRCFYDAYRRYYAKSKN